ncbi:MAG: 4Fe-4S binding protein [Candidatus Thorarchaeota archaeon]
MKATIDLWEIQYQKFVKAIDVPSEFFSVFRNLISLDELQVLNILTEDFFIISNIKEKLAVKLSPKIPSILDKLFKQGFLKNKILNNEIAYKTRSFYEMVSKHLREHRYSIFGSLELNSFRQYYLNKRIAKTEDVITKGKLKFSSKVIPINEVFTLSQHILPTNLAIQILEQARIISVSNCGCRVAFENCSNPIETCLILNEEGEHIISRGYGKVISIEKAKKILDTTNQAGLVHLALYLPGQEVYAICSCCSCCCHELQALLKFSKLQFIAKAEYVASVNLDKCNGCFTCVKRCLFNARDVDNDIPIIDEEKCYGCGLCVTSCPTEATQLVYRK